LSKRYSSLILEIALHGE